MNALKVVLAFGGLIGGILAAVIYATTQWHEAKQDFEPGINFFLGLGLIVFGTLVFFITVLGI